MPGFRRTLFHFESINSLIKKDFKTWLTWLYSRVNHGLFLNLNSMNIGNGCTHRNLCPSLSNATFKWNNVLQILAIFSKRRSTAMELRNYHHFTQLRQRLKRGLNSIGNNMKKIVNATSFQSVVKRNHLFLAACLFAFQKENVVSADELDRAMDDLEHMLSLHSTNPELQKEKAKTNVSDHYMDGWTLLYERPGTTIWSRPVPGKAYYQYKVHGSYSDIPARAFYYVQVDVTFRKQWDSSTHELTIVDKDIATGTEIVHWICNFPRPMYKREYIYARRTLVDYERMCLVLVNRAVEHSSIPNTSQHVRVTDYASRMVIKPHKSFDENGFDYILTYYDDTKTNMPARAYNYMAAKGLPEFLNQLYKIAKELVEAEDFTMIGSSVSQNERIAM